MLGHDQLKTVQIQSNNPNPFAIDISILAEGCSLVTNNICNDSCNYEWFYTPRGPVVTRSVFSSPKSAAFVMFELWSTWTCSVCGMQYRVTLDHVIMRPGPPLLTWISNHMHYKVLDEVTYPFPNVNCATVEVWEWIIINFISHLMGRWLLIHGGIKVNPC